MKRSYNKVVFFTNTFVIRYKFVGQIGHSIAQINLVRMNPCYNEEKCLVPSCLF